MGILLVGRKPLSDLIDTTEMYLKSILELEEEGLIPMRARIGERLDQSGPTVSQTVARMERDGLLTLGENRKLELTDYGRQKAIAVMRKHRLAERLLVDILGMEWELAHEEACRWEHVMSEAVEKKILTMISTTEKSPYGLPIPGLEELGATSSGFGSGKPVSELDPGNYIVAIIGEPLQVDVELLKQFSELGLLPGARVGISNQGNGKLVIADGQEEGIWMEPGIARHFFLTVTVVI